MSSDDTKSIISHSRDILSLAEDIGSELTTRLATMVDRYIAAHKALQMLGESGCDIPSLPYPYSAISKVFEHWLSGVIRSYEVASQGIGHAKISKSDLSTQCRDFDARTRFSIDLHYGGTIGEVRLCSLGRRGHSPGGRAGKSWPSGSGRSPGKRPWSQRRLSHGTSAEKGRAFLGVFAAPL